MNMQSDVDRLAARCRDLFSLGTLSLPQEYRYASVGHCILDAVFSIGVLYGSTQLVVKRYCEKRGIQHYRPTNALPARVEQESLSAFVSYVSSLGPEVFAESIVENRQRTSSRSGILKADASLQFANVLRSFDVEYLDHLAALVTNSDLDARLKAITGLSSGIATQYFWMLAGSEDLIKPDRMILRFITDTLSRPCNSTSEASMLLLAATAALQHEHSQLNARLLDYAIWNYQREKPTPQIS